MASTVLEKATALEGGPGLRNMKQLKGWSSFGFTFFSQ